VGFVVGLDAAPRVGSRTIERRRLDQLFDRIEDTGILLVSAGAGYGKSTALSRWAFGLDVVVAWINCGDEHDDPRCFSEQLASALRDVVDHVHIATLGDVAEAVAVSDDEVVIVFDDVHRLSSPLAWSALEDLMRRRPDNLRIVVSGRDEGHLPWHRLRSQGEVTEISGDDLSFTEPEASALLDTTYGVEGSEQIVGPLLEATQGWAVGLSLAGHALRQGATEVVDPCELGRHRYVRGYFDEEVLLGLEPDQLQFLEVTSVLDRLDPELCDLLTGRSDSHSVLEDLVEHNLFTERTSTVPPVYRYHQLFREYLRGRTGRPDAAEIGDYLTISSRWYEEHGLPNHAIEAALRSGDVAHVESLIRSASGPALRAGFPHTVLRWLSALPAASLDSNPDLALLLARSAGATGNLLAARSGLAAVDSFLHTTTEPVSPSLCLARQNLAFVVALWTGDLDVAAANLEVAEAFATKHQSDLDEDMFGFEPSAVRAYRPLIQLLQGDLKEAIDHVERIITPGQLVDPGKDAVLAVGVRALAMAWLGESHAAREAVEQCRVSARTFLGNTGGRIALLAAGAWCADLDLAESDLAKARAVIGLVPLPLQQSVYKLAEARVGIRTNRWQEAEASLQEAHDLIAAMPSPGFLRVVEDALRSEIVDAASEIADASLNERELAILRLLATGASRREAAAQLYLSVNTVKTHLGSAYRKLGASTRDEAIERAGSLGMLDQAVSSGRPASA